MAYGRNSTANSFGLRGVYRSPAELPPRRAMQTVNAQPHRQGRLGVSDSGLKAQMLMFPPHVFVATGVTPAGITTISPTAMLPVMMPVVSTATQTTAAASPYAENTVAASSTITPSPTPVPTVNVTSAAFQPSQGLTLDQQSGTASSASTAMDWLTSSSLVSVVPNWVVAAGAALLLLGRKGK